MATVSIQRPLRLTITAAACVLLASVAYAQSSAAKLAGAFPRSSMSFSEYWITDEIRAALSEAELAKAGLPAEEIEKGYQWVADLINASAIKPVTTAELREVVTGVRSYASGLIDLQMPDLSGGEFNPEDAMNIARSVMVIDHANPAAYEKLLQRELKGGNPAIESFEEVDGIRIYAVTPRIDPNMADGEDMAAMLAKGFAEGMLASLKGVVGFADGRYVVWGQRRGDVLNAIEGLRGDIYPEDTLAGNPVFKRSIGPVPGNAVGVGYISISEILRLASLFEPLSASLRELELDAYQAIGGHSIWDLEARALHGESRIVFKNDELPGWYKILQCPPRDTRLARYLSGSSDNPAILTTWIGIEDLPTRMDALGKYMEPRITKVMEIIQKAVGDSMGDMPGGPSGIDEDVAAEASEKAKLVTELFESEIALSVFAPEGHDVSKFRGGVDWVVAGWAAESVSLGTLTSTVSKVAGSDQIAPGREEIVRTLFEFKLGADGELGEMAAAQPVVGDPESASAVYVAFLPSGKLGKPLALIGSRNGIRRSANSFSVNFHKTAVPQTAHGYFSVNIGSLISLASNAFMSASSPMPGMDNDPILRKTVSSWFEPFSQMRMTLTTTASEQYVTMTTSFEGLPKLSSMTQMMRSMDSIRQKEIVEQRLRRVRSQVSFWNLVDPDRSWPQSLDQLVKDEMLVDDEDKDPMGQSEQFGFAAPPAGTDNTTRWLLAWQPEDRFGGVGRIAILLNGEIVVLNQKQFDKARALAKEGKPMPVMDEDGHEAKPDYPAPSGQRGEPKGW